MKYRKKLEEEIISKEQSEYFSKLQELQKKISGILKLEPGILSEDRASITGTDGWIYIYKGSNNFIDYFVGKSQLNDKQIEQWKHLLQSRIDWHKQQKIKYLHLFIPSKLAVYPEFFPYKIDIEADRPIIQLQNICQELFIYPLAELIQNKNIYRLYEKQNSHWSFWGCYLVYEILCHNFGITPNYELLKSPIKIVKEQCDLGVKFNIHEMRLDKQVEFKSSIVYDNELINYCNRGSIRILKNPQASLGKMIIFGDSFSNPGYPDYSNYRKRHIHRLASLFAETISEVHFIWSPWVDYEYVKKEKPNFVLTELSERFLVKVPQDDSQISIEEYARIKLDEYTRNQAETRFANPIPNVTNTKASLELSNRLKEQGNSHKSIQSYQEAIKINPDIIQPLLKLAKIYETEQNWLELAKCYRRMIGLNPENHSFYLNLAKALQKQNKFYGAIAAYQEAIALKPDISATVYKNLGDLLVKEKDEVVNALKAYKKAAELNSDWKAGFYIKYGDILAKTEQLDEAISSYQKAIELQPNLASVYKKLGDVFVKKDHLNIAISWYQKAIEINPKATHIYRILGKILTKQGKIEEAQYFYKKVI